MPICNFPGNPHRESDAADPDHIAFDGYDETLVARQSLGCIGSIGAAFTMMLPHRQKIFPL